MFGPPHLAVCFWTQEPGLICPVLNIPQHTFEPNMLKPVLRNIFSKREPFKTVTGDESMVMGGESGR